MSWLSPMLGERAAELVETPFMLLAVFLTAAFLVRRMKLRGLGKLLATGFLALGFLVLAEVGVVLFVRQETPANYIASRDAVSGTVYLLALALVLFAMAPAIVSQTRVRPPS